jgi:hypothetical protein
MDSTPDPNPTVAAALELLRDVLPAIPTIAGYNEAPIAVSDDRHALADLIVQAVRDGITSENEIAAVVLATVLTTSPTTLLFMAGCALQVVQQDSDHGAKLPRIVYDDERPRTDGLHYALEEAA